MRILWTLLLAISVFFLMGQNWAGQPPPHGYVENLETTGSAGTSPVSDGSGALNMVDVATKAELDAVSVWPDTFQGELALLQDIGYTASVLDLADGAGSYTLPIVWDTESIDSLGHWKARSQGEDADGVRSDSVDWRVDSLVCWEPDYTHLVWLWKHCSGHATISAFDYSAGRRCTIDGDCEHGTETCDAVTFDISTSPDTFTVAAHGFGSAGQIFAIPMGLERGHNGSPVSLYDAGPGLVKVYPSGGTGCVLVDGATYWLKVVGANTFNLYQDDGDCVEEVAGAGDDNTPVDCDTNGGDWQALTLFPKQSDCNEISRTFNVTLTQSLVGLDDTAPTGMLSVGAKICQDRFEGVDIADCGDPSYTSFTVDDQYQFTSNTTVVSMSPGECLGPMGYIWGLGGFEDLGPGGASIAISEARRAPPIRTSCVHSIDGSVTTSCMYNALLTNRAAGGNIELELPAFVEDMDFCAVNETGDVMAIDPNGTDRFADPATDTNGDKLTSSTIGDSVCIHVFSDGEARVITNSGGWSDGGA